MYSVHSVFTVLGEPLSLQFLDLFHHHRDTCHGHVPSPPPAGSSVLLSVSALTVPGGVPLMGPYGA